MVLAGLAFQPELWAAGLESVGISSFVTFLENTSPYRRAAREREYGSLGDDRDFLVEASPITHVDAIRAPLFIQHGANDPRVPLAESEEIARVLREKGIRCELVVYTDEGHLDHEAPEPDRRVHADGRLPRRGARALGGYDCAAGRLGRVVRHRSAKPGTPVRLR